MELTIYIFIGSSFYNKIFHFRNMIIYSAKKMEF